MIVTKDYGAITKALDRLRERVVDGCDKCHGQSMMCICRGRMIMYEKSARANIPISLWDKTLDDFGKGQEHNPLVMELKSRWEAMISDIHSLLNNGNTVVVSGPNGTGKTMMACLLLQSASTFPYAKSCQYLLFSDILGIFHEPTSDTKDDKINFLNSCDFLVIDEVGKEFKRLNDLGDMDNTSNSASFSRFVFEHLLKNRNDAGLPTLIITNDSLEVLHHRYGGTDSALSSIWNSSRCIHLIHTGIDYRTTENYSGS